MDDFGSKIIHAILLLVFIIFERGSEKRNAKPVLR